MEGTQVFKIPENIEGDFFEKNHSMKGLFYEFDQDGLKIGGEKWKVYKHGLPDETSRSMESKLLECFIHSNVLKERLILWKNQADPKAGLTVTLSGVWLHDWKPLLLAFEEHHLPIKTVSLGGYYGCWNKCYLSKDAAYTMAWMLNPHQSGFQIEKFTGNITLCMSETECRNWIPTLSETPAKKIMFHKRSVHFWFLPLFISHCRPQSLACADIPSVRYQIGEDEEDEEDGICVSFEMKMAKNSLQQKKKNHSIKTMDITVVPNFHHEATLAMYGKVLCSNNVRFLNIYAELMDIPHDIFKNAIHCLEIDVVFEDSKFASFPCDGLASLIRRDGHLKCLRIRLGERYAYHRGGTRFNDLGGLLDLADLSHLDTFQVGPFANDDDAFSALCNHLAQNKGPKCLKIAIDDGKHGGVVRNNIHDEGLELLGKSLQGNTNIQQLGIELVRPDHISSPKLSQFFQRVGHDLPVLSWFELGILQFKDGGHGSFPFNGLESFFCNDGHLKCLHLSPAFAHHMRGSRLVNLGGLLESTDLTFLDTFKVGPISKDDVAFAALCHQLAQNKGPKFLKIVIDPYHEGNNKHDEALELFGKSMQGNAKIEKLDVELVRPHQITAPTMLQFVHRVGVDMPRLSWFEFRKAQKIMYAGKEVDPNVEDEKEQKRNVLQQIGKNRRIQHLCLPFDDNGLSLVLDEMPKYKTLLRCGNEISDGIWSHALGCIDKSTPSLMFHVVQQIPGLFQNSLGKDDKIKPPLFSVPHHPNCPACQMKRQGEMPDAKRARITKT